MANTNIQSFSGDVEVTSNLSVDTNTLHVDSVAGRVGIGKTDPGFALDVSGTVNATALYVDGSEFVSGLWTSNASNAYYTTGAVGIGTDFPQKDLEVQGTLRLSNAATGGASDLMVANDTLVYGVTKITENTAQPTSLTGFSVSISADGSYAVVGAAYENSSPTTPRGGAIYIFNRTGTNTWDTGNRILSPAPFSIGYFGWSVSISRNSSWAIVGEREGYASPTISQSGAAHIFKRTGTNTWDAGTSIAGTDTAFADRFGESVSISDDGSWAIVGASNENGSYYGAAYIFKRTSDTNNTWDAGYKVLPPTRFTNAYFGKTVSISGDGSYAIVGAPLENNPTTQAGRVYFYYRSSTTNSWSGGFKFYSPDPIAYGTFGSGVSQSEDGSWVVIGSAGTDYNGIRDGTAYIYERTASTTWTYRTRLTAPDWGPAYYFGESVSISADGSWVAVGSLRGDGVSPSSGAAYIYKRDGSSWGLYKKITAPDGATYDNFGGSSISISSDAAYALAGAKNANNDEGAAYIFRRTGYLSTTTPIEAEGTLLSFTGQHICFPEGPMSQGLVVSANKNKYVTLNGPLTIGRRAIRSSESLPVVSLSNVASDRSAFGVVDHFENGGTKRTQKSGIGNVTQEKELGDNRVIVNSLGEGAMWVANTNGPLESGDYITTSNIAGYGQRQEDKKLHSYTVAKITMDCDFDPEDVPIHVIKKDENGQNVLDNYGRIQWEEVPDQTEKAYNIRYLTTDGRQTDQANAIWKAAYVGCTYHCG